MKSLSALCAFAVIASTSSLLATDDECIFQEIGLRVGLDDGQDISLRSYEVYATMDSPWNLEPTDSIKIDLDFETAFGALTGEGETAAYFRIGPVVEISFGDFPVMIVASSTPSLYSEDTFDKYDIGGHVQFNHSIGLAWDITETININYRYQHTSNAGLDEPNPGLDMHTLGIDFTF